MPDDLEEFVAARWHELYAVATVTTGDASSAARATASGLAALARWWDEAMDSGAPTDAARAEVLRAALSGGEEAGRHPSARPSPSPRPTAAPAPPGRMPWPGRRCSRPPS